MADGTSAAKSIQRNKSQAMAAKYWNSVHTETYRSDGFKSHEDPGLDKAREMAANNLRRQSKIRPLPRIQL